MSESRHPLTMPDLDLGDTSMVVSIWFKRLGQRVGEGERLLEVSAGEVVVDLPAPANGLIVEQFVEEDDEIAVGMPLCIIASDADFD